MTRSGACDQWSTILAWIWAEKKGKIIEVSLWTLLGVTMVIVYTWAVCNLATLGTHLEEPQVTLLRLQQKGHCHGCQIRSQRRARSVNFVVPLKECTPVGLGQDTVVVPASLGVGIVRQGRPGIW